MVLLIYTDLTYLHAVKKKIKSLDFVIIGHSILSSLLHPDTEMYRGLVTELAQLGHRTIFLEREHPSSTRDMLRSPYCEVWTYQSTDALLDEYCAALQAADVVMLGSGVVDSNRIATFIAEEAQGMKIFYDTDLANTLHNLTNQAGRTDCLDADSLPLFDLYLSTTGGSALEQLVSRFHCRMAKPLYESIDPYFYYRTDVGKAYDLGFIGSYKAARQKTLETLLFEPAALTPNRKFVLAGQDYTGQVEFPDNLLHTNYLPEANIVDFYNRQHATLVIARQDRQQLGFTPSRRLLAAAACGVPILASDWEGLSHFFEPQKEIFIVQDTQDVLDVLYQTDEREKQRLGERARERVLKEHTTAKRTATLLDYWQEMAD